MGQIQDFVNVIVRLATGGLSTTGFGTTLVVGYHPFFKERVLFVTDPSDLVTAGVLTSSPIYKAVAKAFSQNPKPDRVAVGRLFASSVRGTIDTVETGHEYSIKVIEDDGDEQTFAYTAIGGDTAPDIVAALVALVNAVYVGMLTDNTDGTYDAALSGTPTKFLNVDSYQSITVLVEGETRTEGMTALQEEENDWYLATSPDRAQAEILEYAAWIEAAVGPKRYYTASAENDIISLTPAADTTSTLAILKALAYLRTSLMYHGKADGSSDEEYIDTAWGVKALSYDPDVETATEKFKSLVGITPDNLTPTQRANVIGTEENPLGGKNGNVYTTVAGRSIIQSGMAVNGEWNDNILGADWLEVRTEERIFQLFLNRDKVPYTTEGIESIVGEIRAQMIRGQETGFLAFDAALDETFGFAITVPKISGIPDADKIARILKGIKADGTIAGAIHAAKPITITLSP